MPLEELNIQMKIYVHNNFNKNLTLPHTIYKNSFKCKILELNARAKTIVFTEGKKRKKFYILV